MACPVLMYGASYGYEPAMACPVLMHGVRRPGSKQDHPREPHEGPGTNAYQATPLLRHIRYSDSVCCYQSSASLIVHIGHLRYLPTPALRSAPY
eukprot:1169168-Rhodomonas_salina.1